MAGVCRYVERNALRAKLAKKCRNWPWSSAGQAQLPEELRIELSDLPVPRRRDWAAWVDRPQTAEEEAAVLRCITQNRPYGTDKWLTMLKKKLGWREPLKTGRPRKVRK